MQTYLGIQGPLEVQHVGILLWVDVLVWEYHGQTVHCQSGGVHRARERYGAYGKGLDIKLPHSLAWERKGREGLGDGWHYTNAGPS